MASDGGVGSNEFGFNHLLDGKFPNQPIIKTGDLEFYGELLKNKELTDRMGFKNGSDTIGKLVNRKAKYLALAAELMVKEDATSERLRDIYGNDERKLAEDLYLAAKKAEQLSLLSGVLDDAGIQSMARGVVNGGGKSPSDRVGLTSEKDPLG